MGFLKLGLKNKGWNILFGDIIIKLPKWFKKENGYLIKRGIGGGEILSLFL